MALLKTWSKASLNLLVFALMFPGASGTVWIEPSNPVIIHGGNLLVNCSTDCDLPYFIGLETQLDKTEVNSGTRWKAFLLRNVTQDILLLCFANCFGKEQMHHTTPVTMIQPPKRVELEALPQWILMGQNFTFRCQVWGGRPRQNLTVTLLQGPQELIRQSVFKQVSEEAVEATFTVTASREDHKANFSCRAELDLQARGLPLYQNSSAPVELHIFDLILGPPRLIAPKLLEVKKKETVSCEIDKLFPVEEARIHLSLGGRLLNTEVVQSQEMLRAMAIAVIEEGEREGQWDLTCNMTLGHQNWEVHENLTVYSFPLPNLVISEPIVPEGTLVSVTCEVQANASIWMNGTRWSPGEKAQLSLTATEEYNGYWFTCHAVLELMGEELWRNKSQELLVLYGPRLDENNCPGNWTWLEGTTQTLWCNASGNPAPSVSCVREGDEKNLPPGAPLKVTRDHQGTYGCSATSQRGLEAKHVTVTVIAGVSPRDPVPVFMGVLLTLGLVAIGAAIATQCLRHSRRTGSYQPPRLLLENRGAH